MNNILGSIIPKRFFNTTSEAESFLYTAKLYMSKAK